MKTFTRREYNLVVKCLDYYETFMNQDEKNLSQIVQDKLYYFNVDKQIDDKNDLEINDTNLLYDDVIPTEFDTPLAESYGG
tara:strand:- start:169 stop:411 length:243 start_codon:yes stop_codon:yes gene_type:complete